MNKKITLALVASGLLGGTIAAAPPPAALQNTTNAPTTPADLQAAREAEEAREISLWQSALATPISFYGKVIDEKQNPISGSDVMLSPSDRAWEGGSQYKRTTDENGLFSISGIHGMGLSVSVSKTGYYQLPQSRGSFAYISQVEGSPPHTDPNDPAIFVLRKMGQTEPLIVQNKNVKISETGIPIFMDLHTGKTYGLTNSDLEVQSWTQDQNIAPGSVKRYDWRCVITVPGGGLQPRTGGEFNFTAPTDGYQPSDEIVMSASDPKWGRYQSREYFLKLANGHYARISFIMATGGYNDFSITSYLNPTPGHTNLEYDPNQTAFK